jgi:hypothetical protein
LNHKAMYSAEPPKTAADTLCPSATPSARTCCGNSSALKRPLIDV